MSQEIANSSSSNYTMSQYILFGFVGFVIWVLGVIIVRLAGATVFSADNLLLPIFYILSIPIAVVNTMATRPIFRLQMKDMLTPILVMVFVTLMLDGLAVNFTDLYSTDNDIVRYAAGWLLWSFGIQVIASMWMINRVNKNA